MTDISTLADRRFSGVARLYGPQGRERLAQARVAVIGLGGVGSWAAEALARTGVGKLVLIDLDQIAESNTNRQLHALTESFGQAKVSAMVERLRAINPNIELLAHEEFLSADNLDSLLSGPLDGVLDAIDEARTKVALAAWCRDRHIPLIMSGAAGGRLDPTRLGIDDLARTTQDALLSRVRQQLRRHHAFPRGPKAKFGIAAVYSAETRPAPDLSCHTGAALNCSGYGSSVMVTASFGMAAAAWIVNRITQVTHS